MSAIESRLRKLIALSEAATEGPWGHCMPRGRGYPDYDPIFGAEIGDEVARVKRPNDHSLIARYRNEAPAVFRALLAVLELHAPVAGIHGEKVCSHRHCVDDAGDQCTYPCATVRTIEKEMNE